MGTGGPFPGGKCSRGVTLIIHPHLVPRLSMNGRFSSSPPHVPPWHVAGQLYFFDALSDFYTKMCFFKYYFKFSRHSWRTFQKRAITAWPPEWLSPFHARIMLHEASYFPHHFSWRLYSIVVILTRLDTAWFMQRNGSAGVHRSKTIRHGGIRSMLHVHTAHTIRKTEKCYFGR
jgi:hypothetical protein